MKKRSIKLLSIILTLCFLASVMAVAGVHAGAVTPDDIYSIIGTPEEVFGGWENPENTATEMTRVEDGVYSFTAHMEPVKHAEFRIICNHQYDDALGVYNTTFRVNEACDVTITYNLHNNKINVTGDGVEFPPLLLVDKVVAAGNGSGNWLNGVEWDPNSEANEMTGDGNGIYEISYSNVAAGEYAFRFTANGSWVANWGDVEGNKAESGTTYDALFDSNNIKFSVDKNGADVKLQLDLSDFDGLDQLDAKYTVTVTDHKEPGDVNDDGQVNGADAGILSRYASGWKDYDAKIKNMQAADINGDGDVNGADAGILNRIVSGWKTYEN
ncbi:MAG: dockerin type I domain-containing protein [Ruminococcus sp.]|nr:dockerin type I domain-containing protein [Ruminococcus sp.]